MSLGQPSHIRRVGPGRLACLAPHLFSALLAWLVASSAAAQAPGASARQEAGRPAQEAARSMRAARPSGAAMHARLQLATGAAFAPDGSLWVVGLNERQQLFVQHSPADALGKWSEPRLLETGRDDISADGENRPKIAFGPRGWVVISYTQPLPKPYTGMIRLLRSSDGGRTFSAPFTAHQDRQEITHRFESIAFDPQGQLHVLWVDKRDQPARGSGQSYAGAAIYRNVSRDGGASFGPDLKLADHSCECCRIALATGPDGQLRAMWRHVFNDQIRDHAFADLGSEAPNRIERASHDDWQIQACPHHGPGLARASQGYHAVWFGIRKQGGRDEAAVRYGRLDAAGRSLPETVRVLPDARAEHADVLSDGERVAIVWRVTEGMDTSLRLWASRDGGQRFVLSDLARVQGHNDHPRLVQQGARMVVVWRTAQEIQVHELSF